MALHHAGVARGRPPEGLCRRGGQTVWATQRAGQSRVGFIADGNRVMILIYFDNAATTYPKPDAVAQAASMAVRHFGGNPGRSGHDFSMRAGNMVYKTRKKAAAFFHAETEKVIFTVNCTQALNMALKGLLKKGDHVVTSVLEHNSVYRPLYALAGERGITVSYAEPGLTEDETVEHFEQLFTPKTSVVVCTHASNVSGKIMPIQKLADLCRKKKAVLVVDAAQSAGVLPIDVSSLGKCVVCMAGHKGLYGATGTGLMILGDDVSLSTVLEGGTGSVSNEMQQPDFLPDRFESGTLNTVGIFTLSKGLDFVENRSIGRLYQHEMSLALLVADAVRQNKNLRLLDPAFGFGTHVPVVSFTHASRESTEIGEQLNRAGIAVRAGLHCAPLVHRFYGSSANGAVRLSPGAFNKKSEAEFVAKQVKML